MPESTRFDKSSAFVFSDNLEDWIKSNYLKRCKKYKEKKGYVRKGKNKPATKGRASNLY